MSLYDKLRCRTCGHPRYLHTGRHIRGSRTACVRQIGERHTDKCTCTEFVVPDQGK